MLKRKKKEQKISLKTKKLKHKIRKNKNKEKDIFDNIPKLLDILVPDCINEKMDQIILGDERYSRTFVLATYPSKTWLGWLDGIFSQLGDINLSIQVETVSDDMVIRQLTKKVTVLESELQTYQAKGNINIVHPLQRMLYDYEGIRKQVQTSEDKLFFVTILFRINAKSQEELNNKTNLLKNEFAKMSAKLRTLNFRQFEGLKANLPLNSCKILDFERNMTADGLATMFPISNSNQESSPEGVVIGRNYFTGLPVYLDTFSKDLANPHLCILGESGAGKSVTMDVIGTRSLVVLNRQLAILDNEGEYKKRTESLSGRIIKIRQGVPSGINLFDIEVEENDNGIEKVDILGGGFFYEWEATFNGTVIDAGMPAYVERGFVYGNYSNPTVTNGTKISVSGRGEGSFSTVVSGLGDMKTYYVCAYVRTASGDYVYGNSVKISTF